MWQVSSPWFSTMQNQNQSDPQQPMVTSRLSQVDTSPSSQMTGPFTHPQHSSEVNVQAGLAELPPLPFRDNDQDADQLQADRSRLLFGFPIDQPNAGSSASPLSSRASEKTNKEQQQNIYSGSSNILQGSFCPPATSDPPTMASGVNIATGGLDDGGLYQRSDAWVSMQAAPPLRTFTKVKRKTIFNAYLFHMKPSFMELTLTLNIIISDIVQIVLPLSLEVGKFETFID